MFLRSSASQSTDALHRQLLRIERKLDAILEHLGLDLPDQASDGPGFMDEVRALANNGRKIEAIKLYRESTGVGLKEAKDAVEAMMR